MTIERQPPALFPTLPMPLLVERYRDAVFHQLYEHFSPVVFSSICWATGEISLPPAQHSHIVVFPGEERYMALVHSIRFSHLNTKGVRCPYRKEETKIDVKFQTPTDDGTGELGVSTRKIHYCVLHSERPLLCRMFPFGIRRGKSAREALIVCDEKSLRSLHRKRGELVINQMLHNVSQVVISLWPFLTPAWWDYYESAYPSTKNFVEVVRFTFEIADDVVISTVRGAPPEWRAEMLAQVASKECTTCEGSGIEFYDKTLQGVPVPVPQRRFDLCRTCVLPQLGARIGNLLVDPASRKVLDASGTEFRGDSVLAEDFSSAVSTKKDPR